MASSMVWNETTMRRKDFSGENEWRETCVVRSALIESREADVNSWDERRFCGLCWHNKEDQRGRIRHVR